MNCAGKLRLDIVSLEIVVKTLALGGGWIPTQAKLVLRRTSLTSHSSISVEFGLY